MLVKDGRDEWRELAGQALAVLLAGVAMVVAPWTVRNAIALDRFVPISTGGGQVLFAGTYLPSDGDPERVGAEVVERHPELFGPKAVQQLRLEQILARLAAQRYPELETDKALSADGARTALGRRLAKSRSSTPASSRPRSGGSGRTDRAR